MNRLLFLVMFSATTLLYSQDIDYFLLKSEVAVKGENYERALAILEEGATLFPDSIGLVQKMGDLYFDKKLYGPALSAYKRGEVLDGENNEILSKLGATLARLNKNDEAIIYYERLVGRKDYHNLAVDGLSWLYYKVHRLDESRDLLERELGKGFDRNYAITLGTVYSDLYEYELSKLYYNLSIEDAFRDGASYFASVALYNLSLLEYSFYKYEEAYTQSSASLKAMERASGHLSRGEVLLLAGRYGEAEEEFLRANVLDDTPLSRISLARLYLQIGDSQRGEACLNDAAGEEERSWMYYFGTNDDQLSMDIDGAFGDLYHLLGDKNRKKPRTGFVDRLKGIGEKIRFSLLTRYYDLLYKRSARLVGEQNRGKSGLNSWWAYREAYRGKNSPFLKYLKLSERFEREMSPSSVPTYLLERGRALGHRELLYDALYDFDPSWEGDLIVETLKALIPLLPQSVERRELTNRLYSLNRGALWGKSLALPLILNYRGEGEKRGMERLLKKMGHEISSTPRVGYDHTLTVSLRAGVFRWYLTDKSGETLIRGEGDYKNEKEAHRLVATSLLDKIYLSLLGE